MMKARVMAQFATLVCFMGYLGWEKVDFRIMPMVQDVKKVDAYYAEQEQRQREKNSDTSRSSSGSSSSSSERKK